MSRDPGSLWSPLPEAAQQGSHAKDKFIVHSTGDRGSAEAIYRYFARPDVVVESTFVVGLSPADPTRQLLDSSAVADANWGANTTGISVEVVGTKDDPFTGWQIAELVRLGRWARAEHPIAARVCATATDSGLGWHVMFGAPGPWTPVAKDCPGRTRIGQLKTVVFPAILAPAPGPVPAQEDDDMALLVQIKPDAAGSGGGFFLRDGAGYDYIADMSTVYALQGAGVRTVAISQAEHKNWVAAQAARNPA